MNREDLLKVKYVIEESGIFDKEYYWNLYYNEVKNESDLIMHYLVKGEEQGFDPSPLFDTQYYKKLIPGLKESGLNALYHYIVFGKNEMRIPFPPNGLDSKSNGEAYNKWCAGHKNKKYSQIHMKIWREKIKKSGEFDSEYYELVTGVSKNDQKKQIQHYLNEGMYMGINPNRLFDIDYYIERYGREIDIAVPFLHYITKGRKKGFCGVDISSIKETEDYKNNLRKSYDALKNSYRKIEPFFVKESLTTGRLLEFSKNCIRGNIQTLFGLNIYCVSGEDNLDGLKVEVGKLNLPFGVYFENEKVNDGKRNYIWNIKDLSTSMILSVLPYLTYCVDEQIQAVLLEYSDRAYAEIIPAISLGKKNFEIPENQVLFVNSEKYENIVDDHFVRLDRVLELVKAGAVLKVYSPLVKKWNECNKVLRNNDRLRIMVSIYSFSYGGGEIMPIRLANTFSKMNCSVLVHIFDSEFEEKKVRNMLLPEIPVVRTKDEQEMALILEEYQINVVSTHHQAVQSFFGRVMKIEPAIRNQFSHIGTSHGMYDAFSKEDCTIVLNDLEGKVDYWTYVADKNIEPFKLLGVYSPERFYKIPNGIEKPEIHNISRDSLGIGKEDFVFCLSSRAIKEKGWMEAIEAISIARKNANREIHLILAGDGPVYEVLRKKEIAQYVHLLGFVNNPCDYYAISDAMILPSYYSSESAPLSLIEALQCEIPVIASDIGDIKQMLSSEYGMAGMVFVLNDWKVSIQEVTKCIEKLVTDRVFYQKCKDCAREKAKDFDINKIAQKYLEVFKMAISRKH